MLTKVREGFEFFPTFHLLRRLVLLLCLRTIYLTTNHRLPILPIYGWPSSNLLGQQINSALPHQIDQRRLVVRAIFTLRKWKIHQKIHLYVRGQVPKYVENGLNRLNNIIDIRSFNKSELRTHLLIFLIGSGGVQIETHGSRHFLENSRSIGEVESEY